MPRKTSTARAAAIALALAALAALAGCGGGVWIGDDGDGPDFDVIAAVDGHRVPGFDVFPGEADTVQAVVGDAVELDSSGPVDWSIAPAGGGEVDAHAGDAIAVGGAVLHETVVNDGQLALSVSAADVLARPVHVTVYATSRWDGHEVARIDLVITD